MQSIAIKARPRVKILRELVRLWAIAIVSVSCSRTGRTVIKRAAVSHARGHHLSVIGAWRKLTRETGFAKARSIPKRLFGAVRTGLASQAIVEAKSRQRSYHQAFCAGFCPALFN
jgi:hypothetical protein